MRRAICREFADPVALEVVEEPDPTPVRGSGLLGAMSAISVAKEVFGA
jgi:hypothetical protein